MSKVVKLKTYSDRVEADIYVGLLKEKGIWASSKAAIPGTPNTPPGSAEVWVNESDLKKAQDIVL